MPATLWQTALLFFLIMDPLGNLPFFISTLSGVPPERYARIVLRESLIALAAMILMLLFGKAILGLLQISEASLGIAGGIVLLLIAVKMIFEKHEAVEARQPEEPFVVPLAIPMIAGPSALATAILVRGRTDLSLANALAALVLAWCGSTFLLLSSKTLARWLGRKVMEAAETLMGLLLAALSMEMLVNGIKRAFFGT